MERHLEYGLKLNTEPQYKSLYSWAINEVGPQGKGVGSDQIPWPYSLYFSATTCVVSDNVELTEDKGEFSSGGLKRTIGAKLVVGQLGWDGTYRGDERYSMFGTRRTLQDISLTIYPITDPNEEERCSAWGCVSYTTEIDFRDEVQPDCLCFYLHVKQETYDRFASMIATGSVNQLALRLKSVDGFYSEWSPGISTSRVKVLAADGDQKVILPAGVAFEPPRLGRVGEASLFINKRLEFGNSQTAEESDDECLAPSVVPSVKPQPPLVLDAAVLGAIQSMKKAAWAIVVLLVIIIWALATRH